MASPPPPPTDFAGACSYGQKYAAFGLGRGINGAHPNRPLGDLVVCPHWEEDKESSPNNVETVKPWIRYKQFVTNIWSESKMKAEFRSSIGTDFFKPITLNFEFGVKRSRYNKRSIVASGHQIHTRTFRFDLNKIQERESGKCKRSDGKAPECLAFECLIEKHLRARSKDNYDNPDKLDVDKIAKNVIEDDCQGFTHFVAAIHMGARIFEKKTTHLVEDTANIDMGFTATAAKLLSVDVGFHKDDTDKAGSTTTEVIRMHHPKLKMKDHETVVSEEQECLISYEVLPISCLVQNPTWRKAFNRASEKFIDNEMRQKHTALLDSDRPLYLTTGDKYLNLNGDNTIQLLDKDTIKATPICIEIADPDSDDGPDPFDAEDVPFYMAFIESDVCRYFSMADDKDKDTHERPAKLVELVKKPSRSQLYLVHPASRKSVPLSKWSDNHSYAIAVKKGLFRQWHFLVLGDDGHAYFKHNVTADEPGHHQFKIVGVPPHEESEDEKNEGKKVD
ncbi:uncharacterized protein [Oscarella lobularis]|uniref:uncharacterized protein n=1 Tax=Oscarella lobularis TaxID=121494 RepID=UPI00331423D6